ncbi:hypothetical protein [Microbacterium jejuense]|uniref:hypothetical protein n=1 Tax=Microbacterium jejuense TaxID=1263637 RepID=UPI0031E5C5EC
MDGERLSKAKLLSIELDAICSRNRYTDDPAPVIAELRATAGKRTDVLAEAAGIFAGYFDSEYTRVLCDALRAEIDGIGRWLQVGRERRGRGSHAGGRGPLTDPAATTHQASGMMHVPKSPGQARRRLGIDRRA